MCVRYHPKRYSNSCSDVNDFIYSGRFSVHYFMNLICLLSVIADGYISDVILEHTIHSYKGRNFSAIEEHWEIYICLNVFDDAFRNYVKYL